MKVVILAGGLGSRLQEETAARPKPMVEIGGWPILWHIQSIYSSHGFSEFVVALGYRGDMIKRFFRDFHELQGDLTIDLGANQRVSFAADCPDWRIHCVETGAASMTGGRLKRVARFVNDGTFMMTYGDGVSDVDLGKVLEFHRSHGKLATVTAVRPPARFGTMQFEGSRVVRFDEKPQTGEGWINGGFFVLEPQVLEYIEGDDTVWERGPMERLAQDGQLHAYRHEGFWQPMDTLRERNLLEELWVSGQAPWKKW